MRKVVANTTPLIALADIGQLDLLRQLYGEIWIPPAVLKEIESEPAKTRIRNASWIKVVEIEKETGFEFSSRLHAGEIEVIRLAQEQKADLLLMDDNAAKKTAKFIGMSVTGSLGVLIKAKKERLIPEVKPMMEALIQDGLYVDKTIQKMVLEASGENK